MTPQDPRRPDHEPDGEPETTSFPPVGDEPAPAPYQPQYVPGREEYGQPRRSGLAVVLLAMLVIAAVALGVWIYTAFLGGDGEEPVAAPTTTTVTATTEEPRPAPTSQETTPQETTTTLTTEETTSQEATSEETTTTLTTEETTTQETTTAAPDFRAPANAQQCAANVNWRIFRASEATSCGFAESVAIAMAGNSGQNNFHDVEASSPVTGETYTMRCAPEGDNSFTCRGGTDAVVVLEARAVRD
ncbi:hypothetical protein [Corynebacterium halotolerans]|uniref:Putative serine/threonine protein kinase n=1 Tax=Corynebacterium halotolerans YIM 70093 = DSM 44683 TaxID=1121362 RepID=M1MX75_9CORY|nr:hypothetical protein [Corynebacterium halotolerans]AGF72364.1 putative serine/threonine protein kinase [Corynebacterium halotolerans YIM 70093 = DSM 44683]